MSVQPAHSSAFRIAVIPAKAGIQFFTPPARAFLFKVGAPWAVGAEAAACRNGLFSRTKPICIENKETLEEQTQTKPKNRANFFAQSIDSRNDNSYFVTKSRNTRKMNGLANKRNKGENLSHISAHARPARSHLGCHPKVAGSETFFLT
jgi:hypothetical protein